MANKASVVRPSHHIPANKLGRKVYATVLLERQERGQIWLSREGKDLLLDWIHEK
ncbi:hypothetical protein RYX56_05605 [Alkalihalophilus lindianensis]|uniref:Uncharacterized protein n=1 Tax=Alkalihalophilus lindianensis TaxID=1630542 RepID=A0ABU3X7D4_9BACI|nr:hypothetical protein [Alkalihalophilus lindianensis]MDV2683784.1 hypothetical protein [Alkalihalophilus lindianensis]MDV2683850.1 hypothetical protein [Alkalihalophilus lindianensis]